MAREQNMRPGVPAAHLSDVDRDFEPFRSSLEQALCEPEVPFQVVQRTARRCQAVMAGRAAEERLLGKEKLPPEEVYYLTAASLLGRLALDRKLPEGQPLPDMARALSDSAWFRSRFNGTQSEALRCLHSGALLRDETARSTPPAARTAPTPHKGPAR